MWGKVKDIISTRRDSFVTKGGALDYSGGSVVANREPRHQQHPLLHPSTVHPILQTPHDNIQPGLDQLDINLLHHLPHQYGKPFELSILALHSR